MAMNPTNLTNEIKAKITTYTGKVPLDTLTIQAIAEAVVTHIQANGQTTTIVTGGSSAGTYGGTIS